MANLFDKAKASSSTKKVEKHEIINRPDLKKALTELESIDAQLAALAAKRELIHSDLVETGKLEMVKLYNKTGIFPGTIKIVADPTKSFQFITSDKYLKIDQDRFNELTERFGSEIAEEKTTYSFNNELLEKYQDVISNLLEKTKKISDVDKANLLVSSTSYTIKKGTISKLTKMATDFKTTVNNMVEEIRPIFSVKSTK